MSESCSVYQKYETEYILMLVQVIISLYQYTV